MEEDEDALLEEGDPIAALIDRIESVKTSFEQFSKGLKDDGLADDDEDEDDDADFALSAARLHPSSPPPAPPPPRLNPSSLKAAWEATQRSTRDDWHEWMRRLAVEMLKEAPSPALRACAPLAQAR